MALFTLISLVSGVAARRRVRTLSWLHQDAWKLLMQILGTTLVNVGVAVVALFALGENSPKLGSPYASWFVAVVAAAVALSAMIGLASGLFAVIAPRSRWLKRLVSSLLLIATVVSAVPALALLLTWGFGRQALDWLYADVLLLMEPVALWYVFRASSNADLEPW